MFEGFNFNQAPKGFTDDEFVGCFLRAWSGAVGDSDDWARPEMDDLVRDDPERAWRLILQLCERCPNEEFESILAAGPLENLLSQHGPAFIDRVELEAGCNPRFNHLLGGVWQFEMTDEVWRRVQVARRKTW